MEAEQRRQRRLDGRGAAGDEDEEAAAASGGGSGRRAGRWEPMATDPATGQNADGSFSRTRASRADSRTVALPITACSCLEER